MFFKTTSKRWTAALLLALLAVMLVAPAAQAGGAKQWKEPKVRWKPQIETRVVRHDYGPPRRVVIRRHGDAAPVLAGFLGGLFLGATLHQTVSPVYVYDDPYCHARFASFDAYGAHLRYHHHPRVIRVIEVRTGRWHSYHYDHGSWRHWDDGDRGWDDGDRGWDDGDRGWDDGDRGWDE